MQLVCVCVCRSVFVVWVQWVCHALLFASKLTYKHHSHPLTGSTAGIPGAAQLLVASDPHQRHILLWHAVKTAISLDAWSVFVCSPN